jgi:endonuclease/exonuclease/phosphatase family metal-dependent hydrolase
VTVSAQYKVGDWIELQAAHPKGVPFHKQAKSSMKGRVADGAKAKILELAKNGHWLKIRLEDGKEGWIIETYVGNEINPPGAVPTEVPTEVTGDYEWVVWGSAGGCGQIVGEGKRAFPDSDSVLRVGSWNVRWFPGKGENKTDLDWLACTITWLNIDLLAVQEFTATDEAKSAVKEVIEKLNANTGGNWACDLHNCGSITSQHVGFLWNKKRLTLSGQKDMWEFNARASAETDPCYRRMRPGRYGYVKSKKQDGVDFHIVTVHLKMGAKDSAQQERFKVYNQLDEAVRPLLAKDKDIVILGDWNTMGNGSPGSGPAEIEQLKQIALTEAPGFIHFAIEPVCTEYYKGHGGWLDQVLAARAMTEISVHRAYVSGYCKVKNCANIRYPMPAAYYNISDHCPLVFEIADVDEDN